MSVSTNYYAKKEYFGKPRGTVIGRWWADQVSSGDGTGGYHIIPVLLNDSTSVQKDQWFTLRDWSMVHGDVAANIGTNWAIYANTAVWQDAIHASHVYPRYITGRSDSWEHYTYSDLFGVSMNKNKSYEYLLGRMDNDKAGNALVVTFHFGNNVNGKKAELWAFGYIYNQCPVLTDSKIMG